MYSLFFGRLGRLLESGKWDSAPELRIELEAFNGYTSIRFRINRAHALRYVQGKRLEVFKVTLARANGLASVEEDSASCLDYFEAKIDSTVSITRQGTGLLINIHRDILETSDRDFLEISVRSTNLQLPLAERSPFNRIEAGLEVRWPNDYEAALRATISRPSAVNTCWTKGNYSLAFLSRNAGPQRESSVLFPPSNFQFLAMGFQNDIHRNMSDVLGVLTMVAMMHVSILFILYYRRVNFDTDLTQGIGPLLLLAIPLYSGVSAYLHTNRHSYYSKKRPFEYLILSALIPYLIVVSAMTLYGLTQQPAWRFPFVQITADEALRIQHWVGFSVSAAAVVSFYALHRIGYFGFFVCDNSRCRNVLANRFSAHTCPTTGRVFCDDCLMSECRGCDGNRNESRLWLQAEIDGSGARGLTCLKAK